MHTQNAGTAGEEAASGGFGDRQTAAAAIPAIVHVSRSQKREVRRPISRPPQTCLTADQLTIRNLDLPAGKREDPPDGGDRRFSSAVVWSNDEATATPRGPA